MPKNASLTVIQEDDVPDTVKMTDGVIMVVDHDEWINHRDKVNLMITLLSACLGGLSQSPFGGFLPPELMVELERLNATT